MKILKLFGAVVAVHAAVFIFAFVMPGCRSSARTSSTPPPDESQLPLPASTRPPSTYQALGNPYDGSGVNTPVPPPASGPGATPAAYSDFGAGAPAPISGFGTPAPALAQPSYHPAEVTGVVPLSTYTVVSGDSLWTIARKKGVSVGELKAANNLKSDSLKVGQKLFIPAKQPAGAATASGAAAVEAAPPVATSTYTVAAGDSLDRIARRNNTTVAKIKELNNLGSNALRIGQKLELPAPAPAASPSYPEPAATSVRAQGNAPTATITHTVQGGETLGGIAKKYGVPQREIAVANHISDPRRLQAGQQLVIPGAPASPFEQPAPAASVVQSTGTTSPVPAAGPVSTSPVSSPVSSSPVSSAPLDAPPPVNTIEETPVTPPPQAQ